MRILHYFIGIDRAGGLNRYAWDLAVTQAETGHKVFVIYPESSLWKSPRLHKCKSRNNVEIFALQGGPPVTLLEGVKDPAMISSFARRIVPDELAKFCNRINCDVLHIHSWMGFPVELLEEMKSRKVKIVYTTHDYYGLCPMVNFIDCNGKLCNAGDNKSCSSCNSHAPGRFYLTMRNNCFLLKIKTFLRWAMKLLPRKKNNISGTSVPVKDYDSLRMFYLDLLKKCDILHCNSHVSKKIYAAFSNTPSQVAGISHRGIKDQRVIKNVDPENVRLMFSGSAESFKGLPVLLEVLQKLSDCGYKNWHLDIWGCDGTSDNEKISYRGRYSPQTQEAVFKENNLLIVPSICNETFGFVVAEALACGTAVLASDRVGAQMLLPEKMVYHEKEGLFDKLKLILENPQILNEINLQICSEYLVCDMKKHSERIIEMYRSI